MLYEAPHVSRAKGAAIAVVEIIVAVTIKGPAEASSLGVVDTGPTDGQAHPPVTNIGPDKGPGGKDKLQGETGQLAIISSLKTAERGLFSGTKLSFHNILASKLESGRFSCPGL